MTDSAYRKALADHWLDQMRARSAGANKVLILALTTLLVIWVAKIEPHFQEAVASYQSMRSDVTNYQLELKDWSGRNRQLRINQSATGNDAIDEFDAALRYNTREIELARANLQQTQNEITATKTAARSITFDIPGFGGVDVPALFAPLAWSFLTLGLVVYLFAVRSEALTFASRSLRIYSIELQKGADTDLDQYGSGLAWWMVPLPRLWADKGMFHKFVGAREVDPTRTAALILLFLFVMLAQTRMSYLLWSSRGLLSESLFEWTRTFALELGVWAATLSVFVCWFLPSRLLDQPGFERSPNSLKRREFVSHTAFVLGAVTVFPLGRWIAGGFNRRPRFVGRKRLRSVQTSRQAGFFQNPRSQIYHYVSDSGLIRISNNIAAMRLVPVDTLAVAATSGDAPPRINLSKASISCESAAIAALQANEIDTACYVLLAGIKHSLHVTARKPSYRLADLLAGIAVRYRKLEYIDQLIELVGVDRLSSARIMNWTNPESPWRQRWSDRSRVILWTGIPM